MLTPNRLAVALVFGLTLNIPSFAAERDVTTDIGTLDKETAATQAVPWTVVTGFLGAVPPMSGYQPS